MRATFFLSSLLLAAHSASITWESVGIGGGSFTSGIVPSARSAAGRPTAFARTDVGGLYRLSAPSLVDDAHWSWVPLTDGFSYRDRNLYGGEALAVSFQSTARVFASLGAYMEADEVASAIFGSEDGGGSWRRLSPPGWGVRGSANNVSTRGLGERLAVHPRDEAILLYSSYADGLWRCADAGAAAPTWARLPCGAAAGA